MVLGRCAMPVGCVRVALLLFSFPFLTAPTDRLCQAPTQTGESSSGVWFRTTHRHRDLARIDASYRFGGEGHVIALLETAPELATPLRR